MKLSQPITKAFFATFVGLGSVVALAACEPASDNVVTEPIGEEPIGETSELETAPMEDEAMAQEELTAQISSGDSFNTLSQAIEAAGLTETLNSGQYTVFAPTDAAFEALPADTLQALLQPENQELLRQVLTYHVVPERLPADAIQAGEVTTAEGSPVTIDTSGGGVMVGNANVVEPNAIETADSVVHAVDQVILPPELSASDLENLGNAG